MESVVERDYVPVQNAEGVQMLADFCKQLDQHMLHVKRFSNSIAMSLSMELCIKSNDLMKNLLIRISLWYTYSEDRYTTYDSTI